MQDFVKLVRYYKTCRYFCCGEYGKKRNRPHYHAILFGLEMEDEKMLAGCWKHGLIDVRPLIPERAKYCAKYIQKQTQKSDIYYMNREREFALQSRKPALGRVFAEKYIRQWVTNGYIISDGKKLPIPRSYLLMLPEEEQKKYAQQCTDDTYARIMQRYAEEHITPTEQYIEEVGKRQQREANIIARQKLKTEVL